MRANDTRLEKLFKKLLAEDYDLRTYVEYAADFGWDEKQALVVAIVDRAFRGAWEKLGLSGVMYDPKAKCLLQGGEVVTPADAYRDPRGVLQQHLYRRHRGLDAVLVEEKRREEKRRGETWRKPGGGWTSYVQWAERTYLGEPGTAAREFRFIL
jgi:hypothetical protein